MPFSLRTAFATLVLACLSAPWGAAVTQTFEGDASADWSNPANWSTAAPLNGDDLVFTLANPAFQPSNNDLPSLSLRSLTFNNATFTGPLSLGGNALVLDSAHGATVTLLNNNTTANRAVTLANPLQISGNQTWQTAADVDAVTILSGNLSGSGTVTLGPGYASNNGNGLPPLRLNGSNGDFTGTITTTGATSEGLLLGSPASQTGGLLDLSVGNRNLWLTANTPGTPYTFRTGNTPPATGEPMTVNFRNAGTSGLYLTGGNVHWNPTSAGDDYTWTAGTNGEIRLNGSNDSLPRMFLIGNPAGRLILTGNRSLQNGTGGNNPALATLHFALSDDGSARAFTSTATLLVLTRNATGGALTGSTVLSGGAIAVSDMGQLFNGNLNLNGGTFIAHALPWASFVGDRTAGMGSGADQWQLNSGGFAARGTALVIDANGTSDTTFDRNFVLGHAAAGTNGLIYADAPVVLDRGIGVNTLSLSPTNDRSITLRGSAFAASGSTWALGGPVHEIAGKLGGGATGRKIYFLGANLPSGMGMLRLANSANDFVAGLVLAGNSGSPPDAGSGILIVPDDAALGDPSNTVTMVSSSPSGNGSGWMLFFEDALGAGKTFNRTIVNETRGTPAAPPVGLGSLVGNVTFTGNLTVQNQVGSANANWIQAFNFQTQGASTLTLGSAGDAADLAGNRLGTSVQVWRKTGTGTLILENVNITNATGSHIYSIFEGALREGGSDAHNSLNNARLVLANLGVLETSGTFNRPLGSTNPGEIAWSSSMGAGGLGGGGFAAFGAPLTVDLSATDANLEWHDANFVRDNAPLVFGSLTANHQVTMVDNLGLDDADNGTVTREIRVIDNPASSADRAEISGMIRNRGTGGAGGTGTRSLNKTGTGTLILSGANTYNGTTTVTEGELVYNGSLTASTQPVVVSAVATLSGTGSLARPAQVAGTISPSGATQGVLTVSQLDLAPGGVLRVGLGPVAGEDHLDVLTSVNLAPGAELQAVQAGTPATGSVHVVVNNLGVDPVNGTFSRLGLPLAEGDLFTAGGMSLQISYVGGDGNDVTLKVLSAAPEGMTFASWIADFGTLPFDQRDADDDFDLDGLNNLLEYFAALDPTVVNAPMLLALDASPTTLRFTFRRSTDIPDLTYSFEWSLDFTHWFAADVDHVFTETEVGGDASHDLVMGTLTVPATTSRVYVRGKILLEE